MSKKLHKLGTSIAPIKVDSDLTNIFLANIGSSIFSAYIIITIVHISEFLTYASHCSKDLAHLSWLVDKTVEALNSGRFLSALAPPFRIASAIRMIDVH